MKNMPLTITDVKLVQQMRTAQKDYFISKKNGTGVKIVQELLIKAKSLESMVDKMLAERMAGSHHHQTLDQGNIDFLAS